jgi:secretion/DNA translocation related CpaE-like protein
MDLPAPLLVSDDPSLVSDVRRLAAAAGVVPEVLADSALALRRWAAAPVVLVGVDQAARIAACRPPRRRRVHVLGQEPVPDPVFRDAVALGAESVSALPDSAEWLVELLTDVGDGAAAPGVTIGVVGGAGGAGATVFAAALAQASAASARTLLVDADPLGAGIDRVLGLEARDGVRWDALLQTTGRLSSRSLRESLPRTDSLSVLTWPSRGTHVLQPFAVREVLSAGRRGFDVVVLDLPRHRDAVVEEAVSRCDHVVLVSTLTVPAVTAASRVALALPERTRGLVTRGGRGGGASPESVARLLRTPLLASMGDQRGLDESVDLGAGPARSSRGVLARTARRVVDQLVPVRGTAAA